MTSLYWTLAPDGRTAIPCDRDEWAEMFDDLPRRVVFSTTIGDLQVSTVFLGMDHSFGAVPLLWETMVFGAEDEDWGTSRYPTYDAALAGHTQTVTELMESHDGQSK